MILPSFHPPLHPPPSLRSHSLSPSLRSHSHSPSLLHPFPSHHQSTSSPTTANIQNHPCYCVTVLLCYCVRSFSPLIPHTPPSPHVPPFPSPPHVPTLPSLPFPSPSHPFISSLSPVRFRPNIYTFSRARPCPLSGLFHAI